MKFYIAKLILFLGFLLLSSSVLASEKIVGGKMSKFDKVALDSNLQNECSPSTEELDYRWQGILISMPEKISGIIADEDNPIISPETRMPLCITMQFKLKNIIQYEFLRDAVSVVLVDRKSGKNYTANLVYSGSRAPNPSSSFSEAELEQSISTNYYNVNLAKYIELPTTKTSYDIYATFEKYRSNSLMFSIE